MELADLDGFCGSPFWVSGARATRINAYHARLTLIFAPSRGPFRFLFLGLEYGVEHH